MLSRRLISLLPGLALILAGIAFAAKRVRDQLAVWPVTTDMGVYFHAADRLRDGMSPYYRGELIDGFANSYVYPPLLAEAVLPLTYLPNDLVRWAFLAITIACAMTAVCVLLRGFGRALPWGIVLLAAGGLLMTSLVRDELVRGNVNLWLLLLSVVSLWLLAHGRPVGSGLVWGISVALKPFLAVWILYLLWRREWRSAAASIASSAALLFVPALLALPADRGVFGDWIDVTRYYGEAARTTMADNHSLRGMLERMLTDDGIRTQPWVDNDALFTLAFLGLVAVMAAIVFIALRPSGRARDDGPARLLLEYGVVVGAAMVVQPLTQLAHLLILLPALAGAAMLALPDGRSPDPRWLPALAGWALLAAALAGPVDALLFGGGRFNPDDLGGINVLWSGRIGLLLLFAVGLSALSLNRREGEATSSAVAPRPLAPEPTEAVPAR